MPYSAHVQRNRIYVNVNSDFDSTGYLHPRSITWSDGRIFPIEQVREFRPASSRCPGLHGDCYTVVIHGSEKYLFFERMDPLFSSLLGRWFVETDGADES